MLKDHLKVSESEYYADGWSQELVYVASWSDKL